MANIKFLLKFGQKAHIESFASGALYCSNAKTFWGIEETLKIKGQGDRLEAGSRFFAQRISIYDNEDGSLLGVLPTTSGLVHYEPAEEIPVFCLFAVYDEDCVTENDGTIKISLSEGIKQTIREHFPNADTVAIIDDPKRFLLDIENSIGCEVKHGLVQYYNIDKGFLRDDGTRAIDMEYMRYLTQDVPPVVEGNKKRYVFNAEYVYRCLLCKDVYFKDEQEYRIILLNEKITNGEIYSVRFTHGIHVMDLEMFLK